MDDKVFDRIHDVDLKETMETSYIDYAMSVIVSRALPDVRDGLKPVQRRILWSMIELNNGPDKPHRKCARIVGDTMGKYHPHGDSSIYGALVNMAQDWSYKYPLVDGHGNFGSVDGDSPAAMRYTEARLSKIAMEMLRDINKDTVDFVPNFDETEKEPSVLPARIPNLLINGATGIAVGMATNMPPHNLKEVISACVKMIDDKIAGKPDTSLEEVMKIIKGPDFPTGAEILGRKGIEDAYKTGRGKIIVRAVSHIETLPNGKSRILITEIPYLVNKARLISSIADLVKNKKIDGITGLSDHSSREGMEICIDVRRDANPNIILNRLYKHTQLQDTFGVINLALVDGQPKILNLLELLQYYLKHQEEVVTRRTKYELNKDAERAHILEGLLIALKSIDEVIAVIRKSENAAAAKTALMSKFGLDDVQAQAIVDMRLRALTNLESEKIQGEYDSLSAEITRLQTILSDKNELLKTIRSELLEIKKKYGDKRKTKIVDDDSDISIEDLIPDDQVVITATYHGYVKRMPVSNFRSQNRGGKGAKGMQTLKDDFVANVMTTTNHHSLLFFTNAGRVYRLKAYQIPEAAKTSRGTATINIIPLHPGEKVTALIPLNKEDIDSGKQLIFATKNGYVKKTALKEYENINRNGLTAISLRGDDRVIAVESTKDDQDILLTSLHGINIRFNSSDVRSTGRVSIGVKGMTLKDDDMVVSMQLENEGQYMLCVSEGGLGKLTSLKSFKDQKRGGKGLKCYKVTETTGNLVGALLCGRKEEILLTTSRGTMIRTTCENVPVQQRVTSGVKIMDVPEGTKITSFAKIVDDM